MATRVQNWFDVRKVERKDSFIVDDKSTPNKNKVEQQVTTVFIRLSHWVLSISGGERFTITIEADSEDNPHLQLLSDPGKNDLTTSFDCITIIDDNTGEEVPKISDWEILGKHTDGEPGKVVHKLKDHFDVDDFRIGHLYRVCLIDGIAYNLSASTMPCFKVVA